jgi:hypothetical protein
VGAWSKPLPGITDPLIAEAMSLREGVIFAKLCGFFLFLNKALRLIRKKKKMRRVLWGILYVWFGTARMGVVARVWKMMKKITERKRTGRDHGPQRCPAEKARIGSRDR